MIATLPPPAHARAGHSCSQGIRPGSHPSPTAYKIVIRKRGDTCRRKIKAAAYCAYDEVGQQFHWHYGTAVRAAGRSSTADCGGSASYLQRWGFVFEAGTVWTFKQEGHV